MKTETLGISPIREGANLLFITFLWKTKKFRKIVAGEGASPPFWKYVAETDYIESIGNISHMWQFV